MYSQYTVKVRISKSCYDGPDPGVNSVRVNAFPSTSISSSLLSRGFCQAFLSVGLVDSVLRSLFSMLLSNSGNY